MFDLRPAFRDPGHFNERVSWAALDIPNPGQMPDFQNHMGGIAAGLLGIVIAIAAIILNRKKRQ